MRVVGFVLVAMAASGHAALGDSCELSEPIVDFIPVLIEHADELHLTAEQRNLVTVTLTGLCATVRSIENEILQIREDLRQGIVDGTPVEDRQALAETIGVLETRLLMLRSDCVDYWRAHLSAEQFEQMVGLADSN